MFKCPKCGTELSLTLVLADEIGKEDIRKGSGISIPPEGRTVNFRIDRKSYTLSAQEIIDVALSLKDAETIRKFYIELADKDGKVKKYPIKQVVRTALKRKYPKEFKETNFTAHRARDILTKLGFAVKTTY